jgi:hypothetical protein
VGRGGSRELEELQVSAAGGVGMSECVGSVGLHNDAVMHVEEQTAGRERRRRGDGEISGGRIVIREVAVTVEGEGMRSVCRRTTKLRETEEVNEGRGRGKEKFFQQ